MLISVLKSQKTNDGLGYIHIDDWKNGVIKIEIGTSILHLILYDL